MNVETQSSAAPAVSQELRGKVLWVFLERPDVMNAINADVIEGLHRAADRAQHKDVRAVVIRGTGRAFCAGADLHQVPGEDIDIGQLKNTVSDVAAAIDRIADLPKPVLAAVNGIVAAGGLELVLACDIVVAVRDAKFADAHSNYGLLPGAGGSVRLPRLVGLALAKRMMLTGDFIKPQDLMHTGFISAIVEPEELDSYVDQVATNLAERSPRVLSAMKRLIDNASESSVADASRAEAAALHAYLDGPDLAEGLTAFREKRRPQFVD